MIASSFDISNWSIGATPHHILLISSLIFAKNKKSNAGMNWYLVFSTVSKWRVVVGAKWMVPARVWTLGTRWKNLTQNGWVLWLTLYAPVSKIHELKKPQPLKESSYVSIMNLSSLVYYTYYFGAKPNGIGFQLTRKVFLFFRLTW